MQLVFKSGVSQALATVAITTATLEADRRGQAMTVAVTDEAGVLVALSRMDGAKIVSLDLAVNKARTAVVTQAETGQLYEDIKGMDALARGMIVHPGMALFDGGVPLVHAGQVIGGVGVSGGPTEEDLAVARCAVDAVLAEL